jgi:tRNA(Ile)-lysidine synthase
MNDLPISGEEARTLFAVLEPYPDVALAVSGGPDSIALMHLAARWKERGGTPKLSVLTVDHGLRSDSRNEAEMVARMAEGLGLPHAVLAWKHGAVADPGLQEKARGARYDLMAAYCHEHGIPALATAHTQDDQAETFLMRLARGSGLDGLAAIPEKGAWAGIAVLRPLLDMPKARLIATLAEQGIAYATDPSNVDQRFERARLRDSTEALTKLGLTQEAFALSARRLRRAREALDRATEDFLADHSEMKEATHATIDQEALAAAPQEIALRALARIIEAVGGGAERVRLAKLETLLASLVEHKDKTHTLGHCLIKPEGGRIAISREVRDKRVSEPGFSAGNAGSA